MEDELIEEHMEHIDPNLLYEHRIKNEKDLKEFGFKNNIKEKYNETKEK